MKLTQALYKQHLLRLTRKVWHTQHNRVAQTTGAEKKLTTMGFEVKDPLKIFGLYKEPKPVKLKITISEKAKERLARKPLTDDICRIYRDTDVLQLKIPQALWLTKSLEISNDLPERINNLIEDTPKRIDNLLQRMVCNSVIFDAHQELLPKRKNPDKPMWVYPRDYGITDIRKVRNITQKFLQLCESLSGPDLASNRFLIYDGLTTVCFNKDSEFTQFVLNMDLMITSKKVLTPLKDPNLSIEKDLPDIYPFDPLVGLTRTDKFITEDEYPVKETSPWSNVHTIFAHHNPEQVKNITDLPVTDEHILARSLMKVFTAATSTARQRYGKFVTVLPEPVTVQCIQSDGCTFHFSVFQLNTLDISTADGIKNYWWCLPQMKLYENARYEIGRPVFTGYNDKIFKYIQAFYKNT